ncbi:50S ribosomal protein L17 [Candidatus Roizmanbacteria bacterium]|nr:50S ribosomal protein L17 [Candidatus Roizmanbacteria bacterium]
MYHRIKKIKFRAGKDANRMLVKKLLFNFLSVGKITTTLKKTKVLKSVVEKLVEKAKKNTEANKNYILRLITDKKTIRFLFDTIGPTLRDKNGGYVKVVRLGSRSSDGSEMARLEWAYPIVIETSIKEPSKKSEKKVTKK